MKCVVKHNNRFYTAGFLWEKQAS